MQNTYSTRLSCLVLSLALAGSAPAAFGQAATFAAAATYSTGANSYPRSVAVADVNGDGKPDLLTGNYVAGSVGVLLGTGTGTFGAVASYSTGLSSSMPYAIVVADVSGDGKLDVLTANNGTGSVGVLLGTGTGTFGAAVEYSFGAGSQPFSLAVADVNGDSRPDVLMALSGTNALGVRLGTGAGAFGAVATYSTGINSSPRDLVVADVNGDGKLDVLTVNNGTETVGVLLGTGTGTFGTVAAFSAGTGSSPRGIAVADVNGDGKLDLFTANTSDNAAGVLLGTGTGSFGAVTEYGVGTGSQPFDVLVADVNGDGKRDLLTVNWGLNTIGVLLGTGTGTFGTVATYSAGGATPYAAAVADVNNDNKPDLLVPTSGSSLVGVLLNTTAGTFLPARAALPGTAATLAPNPATTAATLTATGLPAAATQLAATLTDALGRPVRRLTVPATAGAATATVPTAGLAAGLYLLQLEAVDARGAGLEPLPVQRLSVE